MKRQFILLLLALMAREAGDVLDKPISKIAPLYRGRLTSMGADSFSLIS